MWLLGNWIKTLLYECERWLKIGEINELYSIDTFVILCIFVHYKREFISNSLSIYKISLSIINLSENVRCD